MLVVASALTVGLFGAGIWEYLHTDFIPAKTLTAGDRWAGVAVCLIPIFLVLIVWAQLVAVTRILKVKGTIKVKATIEESTEGVTPRG